MARALLLCAAVCVLATAVAAAGFEDLNTPISNAIYRPSTLAVKTSSEDKHGYYRKSSSHKKSGYNGDKHYKGHGDKYAKDTKEYKPKSSEYKPKSAPKHDDKSAAKHDDKPAAKYEEPKKAEYHPDGTVYEKDGYYVKDGYYYKEPEYYSYDKYGKDDYDYKKAYDNYHTEYDSYGKPNWFPKICIQEIERTGDSCNDGDTLKRLLAGEAGIDCSVTFTVGCCKGSDEEYGKYNKYGPAYEYSEYGLSDSSLVEHKRNGEPSTPEPIGTCTIKLVTTTEAPKHYGPGCDRLNVTVDDSSSCEFNKEAAKKCIPFGHIKEGEETIIVNFDGGHLFNVAVGLEKEDADGDYYGKYPYVLTANKAQIAANLASAAKAAIASAAKPAYDEEESYYSESGDEYEHAPYPYGGVVRGKGLVVHAHIDKVEVENGEDDKHESKFAGHGLFEFVLYALDDECKIVYPEGNEAVDTGLTDCDSHHAVPMAKPGQAKLKISKKKGDYGYGYDSYDSYGKDNKKYEAPKKYDDKKEKKSA